MEKQLVDVCLRQGGQIWNDHVRVQLPYQPEELGPLLRSALGAALSLGLRNGPLPAAIQPVPRHISKYQLLTLPRIAPINPADS